MINSKIVLDGEGVPDLPVYESNETGVPLQRNGKFNNTTTNKDGNFSINIPNYTDVMYLAFPFNMKRIVFKASQVPKIIDLNKVGGVPLEEVVVTPKKNNYWWLLLLLLIPILKKNKKLIKKK
jgi:hypothetical protein